MFLCRIGLVQLICLVITVLIFQPVRGLCEDLFYQSYLLQRMRITALRIQRGESSAKELMTSLILEAKKAGIQAPKWASSDPPCTALPSFSHKERSEIHPGKFDSLIAEAAAEYGLSPAFIKAVIRAESEFVADAVSLKGAQGLMQIMPGTADSIGLQDPFDPRANIFGGGMLLRRWLSEFGSVKKALIAYNAGPEWVRKEKRIPTETRNYIKRVIKFYEGYRTK